MALDWARPATRTPSSRTGRGGVILGEQAQRDGGHLLDVAGGRIDRMGAGDSGEVVEANLDPDRAPAAPVGGKARAQLIGHHAQRLAHHGGIVDVVVERPLARLRDNLARGADDAVVLEARAASQLDPEVWAEPLDKHAARARRRRPRAW